MKKKYSQNKNMQILFIYTVLSRLGNHYTKSVSFLRL